MPRKSYSFRALVHSVTIHPNGPRKGFEIEVKGKLSALVGGKVFPQAIRSGGSLVAGVRYSAKPTIGDALFGTAMRARALLEASASDGVLSVPTVFAQTAEPRRGTGPKSLSDFLGAMRR